MKKDSPEYQKKAKEFQEAATRLTRHIREADEVEASQVETSYADMMSKLRNGQRRSRFRSIYGRVGSIAAVLALAVGLLWWQAREGESSRLSASLLDEAARVDVEEVTLIDGSRAIHLKDSADIHYQKNGSSNVTRFQLKEEEAVEKTPVEKVDEELSQIIAPQGKRATVTLSDGTKIHINSGTKLIYPKVFRLKGKREVLLEGEAYLAVAKNKECPFVVRTKGFEVQVLGTEFNVLTRWEDAPSSVVLVNGSVEVTTPQKEKVMLKPSQRIEMDGEATKVENVDVLEYISWKDNMLYLKDRRAKDVFDYLERHYGYKMEYGPEIATYSLTGKLDLQENIEDIMETLSLLLKVHYTIREDAIYITK